MLRLAAITFAVSLLLVSGRVFAGACETGVPSGADPPQVTHLRSYPWTFHAPTRIALDGDSSLLVTDPERQRIVTRDASGRVTDSRVIGGRPISIAVDAQGRIYVGDGNLGQVGIYSRNWEFLSDLGIGAGEFELPGAIAIDDSSGRIYVVDSNAHSVRVYRTDGSLDFSFGGPGDGNGLFRFPAGIFVDAVIGEVYVVDQLNFQVQIFDLQGTYLRCIGGTNASPGSVFGRARPLNHPQGIWVDSAGRILVSDAADGQVKVFDRNGNALATIGEFGSLPGGLRIPMDLVLDSSNRLFVAAANNARLEVFGLDQYQDPETVAPAVMRTQPGVYDRDAPIDQLKIELELPGHRLDSILPGTLQVNGIPPLNTVTGDSDRDRVPELVASFDAAALAQTLPPSGDGLLEASALLQNGLRLEAKTTLQVNSSDTDQDDDGIDDAFDQCPDTAAGALTDTRGCSLAQACPCEDTADRAWRNHGRHLVCVVRATFRIGKANQLTRRQLKTLIPSAARSDCGRRLVRQHRRWK